MVEKISEFRRQMEDGSVLVFVPKRAASAAKDGEGQTITMTYATKAELQPVKMKADHAIRDDVTDAQTMAGPLIVGGHDLNKAVITDEEQHITGVKTFALNPHSVRFRSITSGFKELLRIEKFADTVTWTLTGYILNKSDNTFGYFQLNARSSPGANPVLLTTGGIGTNIFAINETGGVVSLWGKSQRMEAYAMNLSLANNNTIYDPAEYVTPGTRIQSDMPEYLQIATPFEKCQTPIVGSSQQPVNIEWVSLTDGTNNLLHSNANETKSGNLIITNGGYIISPMIRGISASSPQNAHKLYIHLGRKATSSDTWKINMIVCGRNGLSMIHWEGYQGNITNIHNSDVKNDTSNITRFNLLSRGTEDYISIYSGNYSNRPNVLILMCLRGTAVTYPEYMAAENYSSETDTYTCILEL